MLLNINQNQLVIKPDNIIVIDNNLPLNNLTIIILCHLIHLNHNTLVQLIK